MSASNRANLITKLHTALKKHYKLPPAQPARPLLEHILYASLLEDASADLADEGMAKCEQEFYDWNEVRVTTATELSQVLANLPDPMKAARRLKGNLQGVFEEFYTFDLDHLKKENLGKAVNKFEKMPSMTPFVLNYTIQHGLGGHAIPVDYSAMVIMLATDIATQPEAATGKVPGLERAIPKNKGIEFSGLLHQAAVALNKSINDKTARALLEAVQKGSSKRLDEWVVSKKAAKKRVEKRMADEKAAAVAAAEAAEEAAKAALIAKEEAAKAKAEKAKKPAKTETPSEAGPSKKTGSAKESAAKSATTKSATTKSATTKSASGKAKPVKVSAEPEAPAAAPAAKKTKSSKKSAPAKETPTKKKAEPAKSAKPASKKTPPKKTPSKKSASSAPESSKSNSGKKSVNHKLTKRKPR
jgi:hypothetical protein